MEQSEQYEQLMRLRQLTELTGAVHEAQLYQLRMWNILLFTKESKVEVHNQAKNKSILFRVNGTVDNIDQKAANVISWTRNLLGNDWDIAVRHLPTGSKRSKLVMEEKGKL